MAKRLVFDIETNGLDPDTIWVCCTIDADTEEEWYSTDREEIIAQLSSADELIGHNIIGFDIPVLEKIYGFNFEGRLTDTVVLSRLGNPDRPRPESMPRTLKTGSGPHSLAAWGYRIGDYKQEHEDWSQYSEDMLRRCQSDVRINLRLYKLLEDELKDFGESIEIEHDIQSIISRQERDGVYFDRRRAETFVEDLEERIRCIDQQLEQRLPTKAEKYGTSVTKPFRKDGSLIKRLETFGDESFRSYISGPFSRIEWKTVDLNSDKQKKEWLLSIGWKPTEWNTSPTTGLRTSPKLTEDSFDSLPDGIGQLLKDRVTWAHRRSQIQGWIGHVREDGRISAGANTLGTNTGRMRHRIVVNVPSITAPFGEEMRSLFCAPEGKDFIGYDASGLELRMLAHYMNDKNFTEQVLHGDIHTYNQELAGLPTRDAAKTFIYGFIYGAGDAKLGSIVGGSAAQGAKLRNRFLQGLPKLKQLMDSVQKASKRGYLIGLDGRKVHMRRDSRGEIMTHKALNTLLQSAGAIVMKKSLQLLTVAANDLDYIKVIDMHDEGQAEINPEHTELYGNLAVQSIRDAGKHFNLNIELDGEYKVGKSWAETH